MLRWLTAAVSLGLLSSFVAPVFASRAELDGRGLPYLLAIDPSNIVIFPGSATLFGGSALLDYYPYTETDPYYQYLDSDALRYIGPFVSPLNAAPRRFAMGMTGNNLAFGYAMDGRSHNLILGHRSGWGVSVGITDKYDEYERTIHRDELPPYAQVLSQSLEISRRDLRFGLGWTLGNASNRIYELGATADVVYMQYSTSQFTANSDTTIFSSAEWKSEPGLGFDVRLRTLSPKPGFQGAFRFAYEDLNPDVITGQTAIWIRRYALSELAWRFGLKDLDDLVAGVAIEWSQDTVDSPDGDAYDAVDRQSSKFTRYYGEVFVSAERSIVQRLVGRAGIRGSAYFLKTDVTEYDNDRGSTNTDSTKRSQGAISDPEFFLGAGWTWKGFALDGRLRENIDLDNPVLQWSVGYSW